jgi:tetratricopeptide (TPR) repeat protein
MIRRRAPGPLPLMLAAMLACGHQDTPADAPLDRTADRGVVTVSAEAGAQGERALAAWLAYGAARARLFEERQGHFHNQSGDDYAIELGARAALAEAWQGHRGTDRNAYLDLLLEVRRAGFLEEYVISYFAKPGWTIPGPALGQLTFPAYARWGTSRLENHQPQTLVSVEPARNSPYPTVPGGGLPSAGAFSPKLMACGASVPRITSELAAWAKEEAMLDGAALAASHRAELVRLLEWAREQPEYRRRGVTWVAAATADLNFVLGFCAVERQDWTAAARALRESVRLDPLSPGTRLELAHVLVQGRKLDEADSQIDGVLATTDDRCQLARAWRQRGYILVERGRLEDAYAAYQRSLGYEPGSQLAVREMVFIAQELQRLGGPAARAFKPYQPPPARSPQVVTECPAE